MTPDAMALMDYKHAPLRDRTEVADRTSDPVQGYDRLERVGTATTQHNTPQNNIAQVPFLDVTSYHLSYTCMQRARLRGIFS